MNNERFGWDTNTGSRNLKRKNMTQEEAEKLEEEMCSMKNEVEHMKDG